MQLAEAAAGVCDLLWMIDTSVPEMTQMTNLLDRFGPVLDIRGLAPDEIRSALSEYQPEGLASYLDAGMVNFAEVAQALGWPFHTPATALALTDKFRQREALGAAGLPMPGCQVLASDAGEAEIARVGHEVGWPAILKPRSAQGSRYTFLAHDASELGEFVRALGPNRPEMVVEGYLADDPEWAHEPYGGYVSVETIIAAGVISHLALTGRFPLAENFRETGFFIPAALESRAQAEVLALATEALEALGIRSGCCHTEIKFTPDGPRIIEVNGRVGGGVPEMLDRAAGIPLVELTLRVALGEEVRIEGPVPTERIGYRLFLQPPAMSAKVLSVEGLNRMSDLPVVDTISIHQGPGSDLDWRDGSRTHIVAVVGSVHDYGELQAVERLLHREVTVTYADVRR